MMIDFFVYFFIALIFSLIGYFISRLLSNLSFEKQKTNIEKEKSALQEKVLLLEQSKAYKASKSEIPVKSAIFLLLRSKIVMSSISAVGT